MTRLDWLDREEFLASRFRYRSGEHVTFLGPTGSGKTTLGYQLLARVARPKLPAVVLASKPRDKTVVQFSTESRFRTVKTWPPAWTPWKEMKPPGWTLWPPHSLVDPVADDIRIYWEFRRAMLDSYKRGDRILFADELMALRDIKPPKNEPSLERFAITLWTRGRSMGCAMWGGSQKPTHVPLWAYNQAEHLFLHNDPDKRARDRFDEIGGVDPGMVKAEVMRLPKHHFLYIRRDGPRICVIGP